MFFSTMTDTEARGYYALLGPESSRAVYEADAVDRVGRPVEVSR